MFTEKLRILIDVVSDKATAGIRGFRSSVAEADGFAGKLRSGVSSLGSTFKSFISSPQGAAVAITGAAVAMAKAVTAASDLALEVAKLADATGLSTEAASRWVEVGKDMGIGGDQIASLITKLTVALGKNPGELDKLGIALHRTGDGAVDMNATLLGAIDVLNKTTDPTKRAALAQQLFGKSWKEASELIASGADAVKAKLADVDGAKLIDKEEIKQAREFRDAMDKLSDIGEELLITFGQALIPVLTDIADIASTIAPAMEAALAPVTMLADAIGAVGDAAEAIEDAFKPEIQATIRDTAFEVDLFNEGVLQLTESEKAATVAVEAHASAERQLARDVSNARMAVRDADVQMRQFKDNLSEEEGIIAFRDAVADLVKELEDTGGVSDDTRLRIERMFTDTLAKGNAVSAQEFKILIDSGQVDEALAKIERLERAAAAGIHIDVTASMAVGSELRNLMEDRGQATTDALNAYKRNGGKLAG